MAIAGVFLVLAIAPTISETALGAKSIIKETLSVVDYPGNAKHPEATKSVVRKQRWTGVDEEDTVKNKRPNEESVPRLSAHVTGLCKDESHVKPFPWFIPGKKNDAGAFNMNDKFDETWSTKCNNHDEHVLLTQKGGVASMQHLQDAWNQPKMGFQQMPVFWDYDYGAKGPGGLAPCTKEVGCEALLRHIGSKFPETLVSTPDVGHWETLLHQLSLKKGEIISDKPFGPNNDIDPTFAELCPNMLYPGGAERPPALVRRAPSVGSSLGEGITTICFELWHVANSTKSKWGADNLHWNEIFTKEIGAKEQFALVSLHGDVNPVNHLAKGNNWERLLDDPRLRVWVSHNIMASHPKLVGFPIGIFGEQSKLGSKVDGIIALREELRSTNLRRTHKLLVNFGQAYHCLRTELMLKAKAAWPFAVVLPSPAFAGTVSADEGKYKGDPKFTKTLIQFRFIMSPPGAGWDCYRHWEAMYFGTIPIILRSGPAYDSMYDDLPALLVDSLNDITDDLLDRTWNEFKTKTFNLEKLQMKWWVRHTQHKIASSSCS